MIPSDTRTRLQATLHGRVLMSGDAGYDEARMIFNAMIDRRPAIIARCKDVSDVAVCVRFARDQGLECAVRGGGHNVSGKALCDDGIVIDLSQMKHCHVDAISRTVRAGAGLTLGELDAATQHTGLATPSGNVSTTGIAGLTLGGGIGWLNGLHGLACDNVVSVELVTADGQQRVASPDQDPDLFWAVRGAGANLGVVTSFCYRLHKVGPVLGGGIAWPISRAPEVFRIYEELCRTSPDALSLNAGLFTVPGDTRLIGVSVAWFGAPAVGSKLLDPLRSIGGAVADGIAPMTYVELQRNSDGAFPYGRRHYWKGSFLRHLEPAIVEVLTRFAVTAPSPHTMIGFQQMHGQAACVPPTETAFVHRHDQWDCLMLSQWEHAADDARNIAWTRELYAALRPWLVEAAYVNDLGSDDSDRVRAAYGANFDRLAAVKAKYDPDNFFHGNQNVVAGRVPL